MPTSYKVLPGPEHFLPPAAASMGVRLPDPGQAHIHGALVTEDEAMEQAARQLLSAKVPTIFPGPLVLWAWNEKAAQKAKAIRHLYETIKESVSSSQHPMLIPMPDYRPKYPKINPEIEINPNHPNLTIWHNKIDACMFVGVHCHQANLSLKIIRGGTNCYTIAMCAQAGHEDAMLSFRDATADKIVRLADWVKKLKGAVAPPAK
ncbi:MAG TPA: carbon monoxide dehydrogenase beta subunit family protein [Nitrospirales bacterium]|nr:carbon monoxide dehydrogenase beta subunit family protein [Nitrospirales bacterium]